MPSWKKVLVSGSNAHLNHVTSSGNFSGSYTSTGSFGTIRSAGLPLYVGDTKVGIGVTNPGDYNSVGNTLVVGNTAGNAGITIASNFHKIYSFFMIWGALHARTHYPLLS